MDKNSVLVAFANFAPYKIFKYVISIGGFYNRYFLFATLKKVDSSTSLPSPFFVIYRYFIHSEC